MSSRETAETMLIPGELKPYNLRGFKPELTFAVMLLEESLLKTGGIHKSLGLKERLNGVEFIGQRFACLQKHAAFLWAGMGVGEGQTNPAALSCTAVSTVSGCECNYRDHRAHGEVVLGDDQWEVV